MIVVYLTDKPSFHPEFAGFSEAALDYIYGLAYAPNECFWIVPGTVI